jgi:beta-phosphoglucomutase-like phosphatase (HAD superfamily)
MFDAVLFDLDGTLVETEVLSQAAGHAAFSALDLAPPPGFLDSLVGRDRATCDRMILALFPDADIARLNRIWHDGFVAGLTPALPLRPGARAVLAAIGLPKAVVTSSGRAEAALKLRLTGLDALVDVVVTVDDVTRPKPAPDPFLLAARLLGVDPARCLAFEDSETGAEAAWLAGCTVVHVPDTVPASGRWAHHVARTLAEGAAAAGLVLQISETI